MPEDEILIRLKLHIKVSGASTQKAEGIHSGKKADNATSPRSADKVKDDFAQYGLSFIFFFLGEILQQSSLRFDLV